MAELAHRIRRLRWQVRTPGADTAMGMRTMLRELMPDVEAALQQAFDAHDMGHEVRHLARLAVPLRLPVGITPHALMQELASALGLALQQAATEIRPWPSNWQTGGSEAGSHIDASALEDRCALLCALLAWRQHAPQSLQRCLTMARQHLHNGWADLTLDGRRWRVDEAALAHWQHWVTRGTAGDHVAATGSPPPRTASGQTPASASGHQAQDKPMVAPTPDPVHRVAPAGTLAHLQAQLMHYVRTGQIDWMLAGLPADQARQQLRDAATHWVELGMWPDACFSHASLPHQLGAWCRWLSLLNGPQRHDVIQRHVQAASMVDHAFEPHASSRPTGPFIRASLITLLQSVGRWPSDHVHAMALWLAWQHAGGEDMPDEALQTWSQATLAWMAELAAQGPVHDAWQLHRQQLTAAMAKAPAPAESNTSPPHEAQTPAGEGLGVRAEHEPASARRLPPGDSPPPMRASVSPSTVVTNTPVDAGHAPAARPIREPVTSQGHLIAQAGLVLLHPYLARCFHALGLYPAGQRGPIPEALWPRAASLLHWLAMGDATEALECDLGLIKLLLGRSDQDALSHGLPTLLPHEREEAAALLQAVLGHWSALKNTSLDGLRQTFLQRTGWLEPLDSAWQLRVQPAAFDVLLGSLPWGLSMVMLPWMDRPLHVEWNAP
jgi:hypothetical protein